MPNVETLRDEGVPPVSPDEYDESLADLTEHRRELLTLVEFDSREWPDSPDR